MQGADWCCMWTDLRIIHITGYSSSFMFYLFTKAHWSPHALITWENHSCRQSMMVNFKPTIYPSYPSTQSTSTATAVPHTETKAWIYLSPITHPSVLVESCAFLSRKSRKYEKHNSVKSSFGVKWRTSLRIWYMWLFKSTEIRTQIHPMVEAVVVPRIEQLSCEWCMTSWNKRCNDAWQCVVIIIMSFCVLCDTLYQELLH